MSLRTALEDFVTEIEKDRENIPKGEAIDSNFIRDMLESYYRQLRMVLKATEGEETKQASVLQNGMVTLPDGTQGYHDPIGRFHSIKKQVQEQVIKEDVAGIRMINLVEGNLDGTMVPVDGQLAVGQKASFGGQVYIYKGNNEAHYNEEETQNLIESRKPAGKILTG